MKVIRPMLSLLCALLWLYAPGSPLAQEPSEEELERWFESDEQRYPFEMRGGDEQLVFIPPDPAQRIPFSQTRLGISSQSLQSGWVSIVQCHDGLDPVPDAEVVYRFRQMRKLRVTEASGIGQAWAEGQSVQLKDVRKGARLCTELEAKILTQLQDGHYRMRYGPFQRRFLDSYFPLHVALKVQYPPGMLVFEQITPTPGKHYELVRKEDGLELDAWFKGLLTFELLFRVE